MKNSRKMQVLMVCIFLCGVFAATAMGASISENKVIPFAAGGPRTGTLQTDYLDISYKYTFSQNYLTISGNLDFAYSLIMNYPSGLAQFYMQVLFVDSQGRVLERRNVTLDYDYYWGNLQNLAPSAFNARLDIPPQTAGMAFYYTGMTKGYKDAGQSFWYNPVSGINW